MQTIKAIKLDQSNSVLLEITDNKETFNLWFDLNTIDGTELSQNTDMDNITGDWNQYIFHLWKYEDIRNKKFQENSYNYMECLEIATEYFKNFPF